MKGDKEQISPSRKLILGFLSVIAVGVFLLMLPFSLKEGKSLNFLEALFTVVSAVCVTGLTVVDVSEVFSPLGDVILIALIQIGGLGVMTFSSIVFLLAGQKMTLYTRILLKEERNANSVGEILNFVRLMLLTVFIIESIGAVILIHEFRKIMPHEQAIYYGIFHSISAFCNAGFSLFSNSLENFRGNSVISLTISYLIILGGMGFAIINSFIMMIRKGVSRFTLTSKLAIHISMILTFGGAVLFFLLEFSNSATLSPLPWSEKIISSVFQSVTLRTAGFNTIPLGNLRSATVFMACIWMLIGASPGSTGGGIKTTTLGVILFYVIGIIRGKEHVEIFNRRLDWDVMNKALALLVVSLSYIALVILFLLVLEPFSMEKIVFEVVSAFGTVGLTMGITPYLSVTSKLVIIVTMFVGRLGPMTIALALGEKKKKARVQYPKEDILIG
ncbi:potassium transporter KtrB [Fusobacterium necrophorum subsp. funduliforme]|uniref:Potassium uptake protein, TrkH family n=3 Tax=Fusobacterium necrophorum TaxID=859 RepID=A0AAN3VVC6_9FUSO|nr:TrkH family potassium uptake protein [Fusobacterium necrophorum]EHO17778.1 TrkH family potassium uptake protein [Fusobacterium necrophorum subsp. funduliforme 1_1_36S]AVQ22071.1 potassium transporter KtrB [Fusobacterium necrophorum subsp. funduliforme]AYV93552.1 potassium transporter KtrB [Fusobacterium necrophorum subsp. funduliforme]AYV95719.1 potassium transporter KtrB [Fusobacterium necrophorum subsp. funduliforme]EIJ70652.1 potassium uptake protein, TrkH family [Fusobacterium necrophor